MVTLGYSIKDNATGVFSHPFFCRNEAEAFRNVRTYYRINEDSHEALLLADLYYVGQFDDMAGTLMNDGTNKFVFIEGCAKILSLGGTSHEL